MPKIAASKFKSAATVPFLNRLMFVMMERNASSWTAENAINCSEGLLILTTTFRSQLFGFSLVVTNLSRKVSI